MTSNATSILSVTNNNTHIKLTPLEYNQFHRMSATPKNSKQNGKYDKTLIGGNSESLGRTFLGMVVSLSPL